MSKPLDSDLYGDIYGDDDNEYAVPLRRGEDQSDGNHITSEKGAVNAQPQTSASKGDRSSPQSSLTVKREATTLSLPAKPVSPNSTALSYSAQIAQQFSAYQQTPSQERQQRTEIPLPLHPRSTTAGSSDATTHENSLRTSASDTVFGKKPSEMHDAGKMFIGGLNWDTTDEGLRHYFSEFGKVDACTIMRDAAGTSRGFAFLTFEDPSSVDAVVAREHFLDGKAIDPKRAIPREEHLRNTRYFVGGLSPSTTSDSMRSFFAAYGKVVDATVMIDRESGRSKGFGFVTFEDASNADQLVGKIGLVLDDKQIEVKTAQPRSQREQSRSMSNHGNNTRDPFFNEFDSRTPPASIAFPSQQTNPMSVLYQRTMGQVPMMGGGMPMMNLNPMAMAMGMGMNGYHPMGAMGGMGLMGNMNAINNMNGVGNMGALRLGMGPMGGAGLVSGMIGNNSGGAMNGLGLGMTPGIGSLSGVNASFGRLAAVNNGPGPSRISNRGQHNFHPYAR